MYSAETDWERSLTEEEIVRILKNGRSSTSYITARVLRCLRVDQEEREDLIRSVALSSRRLREVPAGNRESDYDAVSYAAEEAARLWADRREAGLREMRRIRREDRAFRSVWYGYDCLDPVHRTVLERYYVAHECIKDIADSLRISERTFWRRRQEAVRLIANICRYGRAGQND